MPAEASPSEEPQEVPREALVPAAAAVVARESRPHLAPPMELDLSVAEQVEALVQLLA